MPMAVLIYCPVIIRTDEPGDRFQFSNALSKPGTQEKIESQGSFMQSEMKRNADGNRGLFYLDDFFRFLVDFGMATHIRALAGPRLDENQDENSVTDSVSGSGSACLRRRQAFWQTNNCEPSLSAARPIPDATTCSARPFSGRDGDTDRTKCNFTNPNRPWYTKIAPNDFDFLPPGNRRTWTEKGFAPRADQHQPGSLCVEQARHRRYAEGNL